MVNKLYLVTISFMFLLLGISTWTLISGSVKYVLSTSQDDQPNNTLYINNKNIFSHNHATNKISSEKQELYSLHNQFKTNSTNSTFNSGVFSKGTGSLENSSQQNISQVIIIKHDDIPSD